MGRGSSEKNFPQEIHSLLAQLTHKEVHKYQLSANLEKICFLCSVVMCSQASKMFAKIKVCWMVFALTHILPFIPNTISSG